jgi:hypothetical protein
MKNLKELEQKYLELGKEIEALKKQNSEKEQFEYPIFCRFKDFSLVVKFTALQTGKVVVNNSYYNVGDKGNDWRKHTDTTVWQQLEVCEKTGFFDGQLVWCWENEFTHSKHLRFYDSKSKCVYDYSGKRGGFSYDNYEPFEGNYPDWALEAFQTLER